MTLDGLRGAWRRSDRLFGLLREGAWLEQPIPLRQPFLFYLAHLPAFAWNHLGRGVLGCAPFRPDFDSLFERGIDPLGVDRYSPAAAWPERGAVVEYRDRVRATLESSALAGAGPTDAASEVLALVVEHELMHHETLLYMVQELMHDLKQRPADWPSLPQPRRAAAARACEVPAGDALLGAERGTIPFGWDNEFGLREAPVDAFLIDDRPVTNEDWLAFLEDGGYADRRLWREEDWLWRERARLERPHSWRTEERRHGGLPPREALRVRSLLEDVPFEVAADWPAMVSWAEAAAFARWRSARLPSEPEWHRAAYGADSTRRWPWGEAPLTLERANAGFRAAAPAPVGAAPQGESPWGVQELVGNGWEWTRSPFAPFPGFEPLPRYPVYSADFFDGRHFVLLGGSWATDERLLRRSFRNWFQPHYPYVFSKLRCVRPIG